MITREAAARNRTVLFSLVLCISVTITGACVATASLSQPDTASSKPPSAVLTPQNQEVQGVSTEAADVIPATGVEMLSITSCPGWDLNKMYAYGEYLYGFYCAGCHGRQGQGVPFSSHYPPLVGSKLADSEDISHSLRYMMNTDIHPNATMFFEKDALAVINYIRITFASNMDIICPGEYVIEINP